MENPQRVHSETSPASYDQDVMVWAFEQARLIRSGRFDKLDIERIADEIEDVGRSERRELASRMAALLAHLLKWKFQPSHQSPSWERTVREQRKQVLRKLRETPSLRNLLSQPEWIDGVWGDAVTQAITETGLDCFPEMCPWSTGEVLSEHWLPG